MIQMYLVATLSSTCLSHSGNVSRPHFSKHNVFQNIFFQLSLHQDFKEEGKMKIDIPIYGRLGLNFIYCIATLCRSGKSKITMKWFNSQRTFKQSPTGNSSLRTPRLCSTTPSPSTARATRRRRTRSSQGRLRTRRTKSPTSSVFAAESVKTSLWSLTTKTQKC